MAPLNTAQRGVVLAMGLLLALICFVIGLAEKNPWTALAAPVISIGVGILVWLGRERELPSGNPDQAPNQQKERPSEKRPASYPTRRATTVVPADGEVLGLYFTGDTKEVAQRGNLSVPCSSCGATNRIDAARSGAICGNCESPL